MSTAIKQAINEFLLSCLAGYLDDCRSLIQQYFRLIKHAADLTR